MDCKGQTFSFYYTIAMVMVRPITIISHISSIIYIYMSLLQ